MGSQHNQKQSLLKRWFDNRMPIADTVILQQRSTYILPTRAGFLMFAVILLMMIAATNYQNNLAFLLTFLIVSIGLVSILFTFKNLQGLIFKAGSIESVCAGETIQVYVHVSSQSNQSHMTIGAGFSHNAIFYLDVDAAGGSQFILPIKSKKRGWFYLPRIMATSSFPFGLLRVWTWFKFKSPILVYPQPIEPPVEGGLGNSEEEEGSRNISGIDDLYGLKTYQPGDPISRIDWKALARERGLFSKEFVAYQSQELVFNWNDYTSAEDELKLSYLCYLVVDACKNNYEYSLIIPGARIEKNSGELHRRKCLEALAMYGMAELK